MTQTRPRPDRPEIEWPTPANPIPAPDGFVERADEIGIRFEPGEIHQLGRYLALLLAANDLVNLTAIKDPDSAWERHILDSLTLLAVLADIEPREDAPLRIIDIGSGGGLPGIPLAICRPDAHFTLLDATEKKCKFLRHVAASLNLDNVTVLQDRAERAGQERGRRIDRDGLAQHDGALRSSFDVVTARAVGALPTLLELTVPLARIGGLCVLIKGERAEAELADAAKALHMLHASHAGTIETPTGRIVVIEKRRDTPRDYPRSNGEPKNRPLGIAEN